MKNDFGAFLRQKRQEKNMTQKELAIFLHVSESAVCKWEKNVARPDISLLPPLSKALGVTEHELITASIDLQTRTEKTQAKRWRVLSQVWSLFFYIAYGVAVTTCFICNLAVNKTLSWFWIVLSALLLSFSFTSLPKLIKSHRLVLVPLSMYTSLCILLGVCAIYTSGSWFFIAIFSVLLGLTPIFTPIYIAKLDVFKSLRKYNDFVSLGASFVMLLILLLVINLHGLKSGNGGLWFPSLALPIVLCIYLILNIFLSVRFLKTNRFTKTGVILFLSILFTYLIPPLIKVNDPYIKRELDDFNVFLADLSSWQVDVTLEQNIHCIVFLTLAVLTVVFSSVGIVLHYKSRKKETKP